MFNLLDHIRFWVSGYKRHLQSIAFVFLLAACNSNNVNETDNKHSSNHSGMPEMEAEANEHNGSTDSGNHNSHTGSEKLADTASDTSNWNALSTNRTVISAQQGISPTLSNMDFTFTGNGYIAFDYRRNKKVAIRVAGRIERLFVKFNYQYVYKGERIMELYSPELNTYIEEYLFVKQQSDDTTLQMKAKQKLLLLGLTASQIKQIELTKQSALAIPIYSPYDGYVLFNSSESPASADMQGAPSAAAGMGTQMSVGTGQTSTPAATRLEDNSIREGMYVSQGQTLFWINDFKQAWGIIAFTKETEKYVKKGIPVEVRSELMPEKPIYTSIQLIEQVYQKGQKFTQARVFLSNSTGMLKQNSLLTATITLRTKTLMVPASSVYYLGKISIVWVRMGLTKGGNNVFQSRVVKTRHRTKDEIEIVEGIKQNETIAKDAGYLADSETIITY
ncbi:hypothetical protein A3860_34365 [Niastella vici]|uniref:RND efflux pump membrane fusion protein barrel-sandwich domain-containing protein n=1 Tax=Niastella vici TaxID=1703345 RepID=A0A1V9FPE4_9BACT|nr:efflux RND transporter periplasmic adaptor subunit [Niastella vici]OQP60167.1 hypothetical protein A3860_34365 [Niastella vici]